MRASLLALTALCLAGCGADTKLGAAQDIHELIVAVKAGDTQTFESHIDRPALRASVAAQARAALQREGVPPGLEAMLGGNAIDRLADQLIRPETFNTALQQSGMTRTPSAAEIATQLRVLGDDRVCLPREPGSTICALTFAERGDTWKLVDIAATVSPGGAGGVPAGPMQGQWPGS